MKTLILIVLHIKESEKIWEELGNTLKNSKNYKEIYHFLIDVPKPVEILRNLPTIFW